MQIEVRNGSVFITGYINATGKESHFLPSPKGKFKEIIQEGAFNRALQRAKDVLLLFNHQESRKLGSLKAGNMELQEDSIGLKIRAELTDSEIVQNAKQSGFLKGWSFGFQDLKSRFDSSAGYERRFIEDLDLYEVSLLGGMSKPAYPATSIVEVRNQESIFLERRYSDFEQLKNPEMDFSRYEKLIRYYKLKG
ncbi:HK97 family phage prohead protease [Neobacillus sp. MER 74]|uniref:HK97 family phage prohead protease n=1 Tax=Neobacillus sp. MER 74 TaxID=2939566 RepID=UPI00203B3F9C|nr:HK97 family phage prohead protease [Neobacillus sp. MER 74]MCM3116847.1 HK97 family phage prohead protease [Neobacillus sp. MER 74]